MPDLTSRRYDLLDTMVREHGLERVLRALSTISRDHGDELLLMHGSDAPYYADFHRNADRLKKLADDIRIDEADTNNALSNSTI